MHRKIASHLAVLAIGLGAGIGSVAVANDSEPQQQRPTARASAADSRIVNELRDMNETLRLVNKSIGGYEVIAPRKSVVDLLRDICRNTKGESYSIC